jgi:[protein-PII] uridylyltransferase
VPPSVRFADDASAACTVLDVRAADQEGVLFAIASALAELDLDIRAARVATRGDAVVDAFYVIGPDDGPLTDADHREEVVRAILHRLTG